MTVIIDDKSAKHNKIPKPFRSPILYALVNVLLAFIPAGIFGYSLDFMRLAMIFVAFLAMGHVIKYIYR